MLHNTLQLQHPIFVLYLALFPVFSISRLSPYCFNMFRGLLESFPSTSLIFCYYIVPNNNVALIFYNNIVSQASYMHLNYCQPVMFFSWHQISTILGSSVLKLWVNIF